MNKFHKYYDTSEKIKEISLYVHNNFKLIMTKMLSEMRRKLDIESEISNEEGYLDLAVSLQGRLFNEMVYSLAGVCQYSDLNFKDIIPKQTILILLDLMNGKNYLEGNQREDVPKDLKGFFEYYQKEVEDLRKVLEALP